MDVLLHIEKTSVVDPDPDSMGSLAWIRIQEDKNDPEK
jgi:hypothetical protein